MPNILTPVGRLVAGSVYNANTTDWQGAALVTKTGPNAGQPRSEYFFALAIAKGQEQHWSQTEWGQVIYNAAASGFPNGEPQRPDFAWKITDGDSTVPNKNGKTPASKEGYPGHWVLSFSSGFAPNLYNANGTEQLMVVDAIKTGYFVQVSGSVEPNGNPGNPGVYMNHSMVALAGYGPEISVGPDAASVGFGGTALPPGASATPVAGAFNPAAPALAAPAAWPQVPNHPVGQPQTQPVAGAQPVPQVAALGAIPAMDPAAQYVQPGMAAPAAPAAVPVAGANAMTPGYLVGGQ